MISWYFIEKWSNILPERHQRINGENTWVSIAYYILEVKQVDFIKPNYLLTTAIQVKEYHEGTSTATIWEELLYPLLF